MILSDQSIQDRIEEGSIIISPLDRDDIQPASVDLHLGTEVRLFRTDQPTAIIDVSTDNTHLLTDERIPKNQPFLLGPGSFALASTRETITLPTDTVARLDGKSSLGRLGLLVHATAGYIDPGFHGTVTLELHNATGLPITLFRNMKIAQVSFIQLSTPARRPYGSPSLNSKYQGQTRPTPSLSNQDFITKTTERQTP